MSGLALKTLAHVDRALEFLVDAGHGIERHINPTALRDASIPKRCKGIGTCALDVLVKIGRHRCAVQILGGTDRKNTGKDLNSPECSRYKGRYCSVAYFCTFIVQNTGKIPWDIQYKYVRGY